MVQIKTPAWLLLPLLSVIMTGLVFAATGDLLGVEETMLTPAGMQVATDTHYADLVPANQWEVIDGRLVPLILPVAEFSAIETAEQTQSFGYGLSHGACSGGY